MTKPHASILIVEDDIALNDAYTTILRTAGHNVESVFNGQEALDHLASRAAEPDIILLDLRMPVLDGIGFLREFQPVTHPKCTVVVFSNYDAHKDIDEAYSLGVDRYVLKARAAPQDLIHLVDGVLSDSLAVEV
ncbi:MAG: response regulator [Candidatus Saccharibacteria bacterium]|jgi:CheY-like chemotaxis protein|nr:response regulator [Patescibacteria group bacterium]MCA9335759.1 response regulator [Candidatus Saccharibacteria bacterium]MCA9336815.1 response regulator [Candidatus Saccharibacteria bacterium]MCA9339892.1 response regulator [Candidatus Saccharibacteria bacterium]HPQ82122.1 response regulator [Candidatus Saccharimonas sp.]